MIVRLVWAIIPLVLFGIIGISESFAEERTWYLGEGLKQGDYFSYKLCHADYNDCSEFQMDLWIEGDAQRGSETHWLTQTVVYDDNKIVKGVMHLGKVAPEPVLFDDDLFDYAITFKTSIVWLSAFATAPLDEMQSIGGPINLDDSIWKMRFVHPTPLNVTGPETITVPGGTFETYLINWKVVDAENKIWVVDDFPFPIKASAWTHVTEGIPPQEFKFELLDYKENVIVDPFVPITPLEESFAEENIQDSSKTKNPIYIPSDITKANPNFVIENGERLWETIDIKDVKDDVVYTIQGTVLSIDDPIDWKTGVIFSTVKVEEGYTNEQIIGFIPITISVENVYKGNLTDETFTFYVDSNKFNDEYHISSDAANFEIGEKVLVNLAHSDLGSFPDGHYYPKLGKFGKYQINESNMAFNVHHPDGIAVNRIMYESLHLKQQLEKGLLPENITCKEGLELIFKSTDGSPACVKPKTAEKLIERGWAAS